MSYKYRAYSDSGEIVSGVLDVDTEAAAEATLWQANLTVLHLQKQRERPSLDELLPTLFGIKRSDLITFSGQLATLLTAGISIVAALRVLAEHVPKATFKKALRSVINDVQSGSSLSQACAKQPQVFPVIYIRLIEVGEETGRLDLILNELVVYFTKAEAVASRVRSSLGYPAFIFLLALGAVGVMINFVLPAMGGLFREFGSEPPLITRILVAIANFVQASGLTIFFGIVMLAVLFLWYSRTPQGIVTVDSLMVRLPLIGNLNLRSNIARLARTMAMLMGAGVSITESLELVVQTTTNSTIRDAITTVRSDIYSGKSLSMALASVAIFPVLLSEVVGIGEQTGKLEANLEALAGFYEQETDRSIAGLVGLIEPVMIILVGIMVGAVAISIISPIYEIMQHID